MSPEPEISSVRIDKFLWSVRLYKTRSQASDECRKGRVIINNIQVKPSRIVEGNEIITVRKPPVTYTYRVIKPIENRVSAKLASNFIEDLTPEQEKIKLEISHSAFPGFRQKGLGRPTKKERRNLNRFIDDHDSP
ncbi:MAG: RNA-binding S4 domain-containing protein [Bacteroidales bacterium]|nr:RNA-binding S4 domain-containing protein [Bacteroidales bacterium]